MAQLSLSHFEILGLIGSGSFAKVYKARDTSNESTVAIKAIRRGKLTPKLEENLSSEIGIMKESSHPNILKMLDLLVTQNHFYLIVEYCAGGDLHDLIKKKSRLDEEVAQHFLRQLASGLHFLCSQHIIHRDLKPQNLLLTSCDEDVFKIDLKIADFGFARNLVDDLDLADTLCGSPLYMSPEVLSGKKYDNKADLWSVGVILYEMLVGQPPFTGTNPYDLLNNIKRNELVFPDSISMSDSLKDLLRGLLVVNPTQRFTFQEFFASKFLDQRFMLSEMGQSPKKDSSKCGNKEYGVHSLTPDPNDISISWLSERCKDVDKWSNEERVSFILDISTPAINLLADLYHHNFSEMVGLLHYLIGSLLHCGNITRTGLPKVKLLLQNAFRVLASIQCDMLSGETQWNTKALSEQQVPSVVQQLVLFALSGVFESVDCKIGLLEKLILLSILMASFDTSPAERVFVRQYFELLCQISK
eukprot:TRINITY_DN557_c0_g2_i1.p1 TRINITY_DN557_c0_g2~~TRINITY_DN557_c0_g2_i1.p1  ORF type:complete len:473 (-),score=55.68 TRINITY_DN557_c0_g2_i1:149-1567(-)